VKIRPGKVTPETGRINTGGRLIVLLSFILLAPGGQAAGRLIELEDFSWGLPLDEVARRAEDHGYRLRKKDTTRPEPHLEYRAFLYGGECRILFAFTPITGKLHTATVTWRGEGFGDYLRGELVKELGRPREEIPGAKISIWTRRHTELNLRIGRKETTLTYIHLHFRKEAREERIILRQVETE